MIQFTIVGKTANTPYFSIIFPDATVRGFGEVGDFSHGYICDLEGEYGLRSTNKDQKENKLVILNYEAQHYIFGIPQMLFLTLMIVLACIGGFAAFALMRRRYRYACTQIQKF